MDGSSDFDTEARAEEHLIKAINYQRMGLSDSARNELRLARQLHPAIMADPRYQAFHIQKVAHEAQAEAWKLPLRVGAGILIADILMTAFLWLMSIRRGVSGEFLFWGLAHIGIDLFLAISLLRLKDTARRATIWWALLGLIVGVLEIFVSRAWLDLVMQFSFSGALVILLVGKPAKFRVVLSVGIFLLGYFGSFFGAILLNIAAAIH